MENRGTSPGPWLLVFPHCGFTFSYYFFHDHCLLCWQATSGGSQNLPPKLKLCPVTSPHPSTGGNRNELSVGTGCVSSLQSVGSVYSGLMQGVGAAEKVFEFIDRQPTMVHDGSLAPDHLEGRVDFENVTFTYRTRPHTQVLQVRVAPGLPEPSFLHLGCVASSK